MDCRRLLMCTTVWWLSLCLPASCTQICIAVVPAEHHQAIALGVEQTDGLPAQWHNAAQGTAEKLRPPYPGHELQNVCCLTTGTFCILMYFSMAALHSRFPAYKTCLMSE